jgi:hypothetical protein
VILLLLLFCRENPPSEWWHSGPRQSTAPS